MPYANNQGTRIHYQVAGDGTPMVLQHGSGDSLESWRALGYVQALQHDYRLILLDARGHGASDKPYDPDAYTLQQRVEDIVGVLDHLHIDQAHFWGYSMGGWLGFGVAQYAPERCRALLIGGAHPYARSFERARQQLRTGLEQGVDTYVATLEATAGALWPAYRTQLLANDCRALLAAAQDRPSLEEVLPTIAMPCFLYAGEKDTLAYPAIRECSTLIAKATFVSFPGLSHLETFVRSDLVLPHVTRFLATVPQ